MNFDNYRSRWGKKDSQLFLPPPSPSMGNFGKLDAFGSYDLVEQMTFVEKRETKTLSVGGPDHHFGPDKFELI